MLGNRKNNIKPSDRKNKNGARNQNANGPRPNAADPKKKNKKNADKQDSNNAGGDSACFPRDAVVETPGGFVRMDELAIGSLVKDFDGSFTKVSGFLHKSIDIAPQEYIVLHFDQFYTNADSYIAPNTLEISAKHRIFLQNGNDIFAVDVKVGDRLASGQIVNNISSTMRDSLFAPVTESGVITVEENIGEQNFRVLRDVKF